MEIKRIPAGVYAANCYLLIDEKLKECAVIDPGGDGDDLIRVIKQSEIAPKFILLTHGHADHTEAVPDFIKEFNIPVYVNKNDALYMKNCEYLFGHIAGEIESGMIKYAEENDVLSVGDINIKCIETPGHTPGGMCFIVKDSVFTGDTLFLNSIGRTDLSGGDYNLIIKSIKSKLMILPDDMKVFPGHGPQTTIKHERSSNPFLK